MRRRLGKGATYHLVSLAASSKEDVDRALFLGAQPQPQATRASHLLPIQPSSWLCFPTHALPTSCGEESTSSSHIYLNNVVSDVEITHLPLPSALHALPPRCHLQPGARHESSPDLAKSACPLLAHSEGDSSRTTPDVNNGSSLTVGKTFHSCHIGLWAAETPLPPLCLLLTGKERKCW